MEEQVSSESELHNLIPASPVGITSWNDYEAIRQVISGYCHIVDRAVARGETPDTSDLYHPQAEYTNSFEDGEVQVGHAAVVAWYHKFLGKRTRYYRYMRHKIFEPYIVIKGDTAEVTTHYDADSIDRNNIMRAITGRYDDSLIKYQGRWLIRKRHVLVHYHYVVGDAQRYVGWGRDKPGVNDGWDNFGQGQA